MTGEEGMQKGATPKAAAPATVTGKVAMPLAARFGKAGNRGGNPESASRETCLRKD